MLIARLELPPVVNQSIIHTPLTIISAAAFVVIAAVALVVVRWRPAWALGLLAFWTPFAFYRDIGPTTITVEKALLAGVVVGLLTLRVPWLPRSQPSRVFLLAGLAVLATTLLSVGHAAFLGPAVRETLKIAEYLVLAWCAVVIVERQPQSAATAFSLGTVAALLVVALYSAEQAAFGGSPSGIFIRNQIVPRVSGPLEGPNQLGGYLEAALPIAWLAPFLDQRLNAVRWIAVFAGTMALVMSESRAGLVMVIVGFVALWFVRRPAARVSLAPVCVGLAAGLGVVILWYAFATHDAFAAMSRFGLFASGNAAPSYSGGVGNRRELWSAAIHLFERDAIIGVGAGNFERMLPSVGVYGVQTHANSLWLQTLAEQGLLGLFAIFTLAIMALRETYVGIERSWLAAAAFIAGGCLVVHQFVDDLFFFPKVAMLWWLLMGAATAAVGVSTGSSADAQASLSDKTGGPSSGQATPTNGSFHLSSRS